MFGKLKGASGAIILLVLFAANNLILMLIGGVDSLFAIIFHSIIENLLLFVGAQLFTPLSAAGAGFASPVIGYFMGIVPDFAYVVTWGIANIIVAVISAAMSRQSNFFGVLLATVLRFLYLLLMVRLLVPMLNLSATPAQQAAMSLALFWPQAVGCFVGGLLSMPLLFSLLLRTGILIADPEQNRIIDTRLEPEYKRAEHAATASNRQMPQVRRQDKRSDEELFGSDD
ncbi:hypothetical protein LJC55_03445 [Eubacteriales bacterium OttesenSCG-928-N14]|nr:hypothetical protein [Eubacteriales bacterium OttesenSCG-928-N14]